MLVSAASVPSLKVAGILAATDAILTRDGWIPAGDWTAPAPTTAPAVPGAVAPPDSSARALFLSILRAHPIGLAAILLVIFFGAAHSLYGFFLSAAPPVETAEATVETAAESEASSETTMAPAPIERGPQKVFILPESNAELFAPGFAPVFGTTYRSASIDLSSIPDTWRTRDDSALIVIPAGTRLLPHGEIATPATYRAARTETIATWNSAARRPVAKAEIAVVADRPADWDLFRRQSLRFTLEPAEEANEAVGFLRFADRNETPWDALQLGVWTLAADIPDSHIEQMRIHFGPVTMTTYVDAQSGLPVGGRVSKGTRIISEDGVMRACGLFMESGLDPGRYQIFRSFLERKKNAYARSAGNKDLDLATFRNSVSRDSYILNQHDELFNAIRRTVASIYAPNVRTQTLAILDKAVGREIGDAAELITTTAIDEHKVRELIAKLSSAHEVEISSAIKALKGHPANRPAFDALKRLATTHRSGNVRWWSLEALGTFTLPDAGATITAVCRDRFRNDRDERVVVAALQLAVARVGAVRLDLLRAALRHSSKELRQRAATQIENLAIQRDREVLEIRSALTAALAAERDNSTRSRLKRAQRDLDRIER